MSSKEPDSEKDNLSRKIDNNFRQLKRQIMYFHDKDLEYAKKLSDWLLELATKNKIIHSTRYATEHPDKEKVRRRRGKVYYMDLGVGVGSELNYPHFVVVLKEYTYTAIVVPISSVKDEYQPWKNEKNSFIEIGKIQGLTDPDTPDSYAVVGHIQTVSKQRLSYYRKEDGTYLKDLHFNNDQMNKVDKAIRKLTKKELKEEPKEGQ